MDDHLRGESPAGTGGIGGVGQAGNDLDIDSSYSAAGTVSVASKLANAYIIEVAADKSPVADEDLVLMTVDVEGNDTDDYLETAFITAPLGRILNGNTTGSNVISGKVWLFATGDVGAKGNPLTTEAQKIEGRSTLGSIFIDNRGALEVGGVGGPSSGGGNATGGGMQTEKQIEIRTGSPITIASDVSAGGDISIWASDDNNDTPPTGDPDHLTIAAGFTVESTGGSVTLLAGADLVLETGASVVADTSITLEADYGDADAAAGSILLDGAIVTAGTSIEGTATGDVVIRSTTVTAGTDLSLTAGGTLILDHATLAATAGGVSLAALGGPLTVPSDSSIAAATSMSFYTATDLVVDSDLAAGESISLTAGNNITVKSAITTTTGSITRPV